MLRAAPAAKYRCIGSGKFEARPNSLALTSACGRTCLAKPQDPATMKMAVPEADKLPLEPAELAELERNKWRES